MREYSIQYTDSKHYRDSEFCPWPQLKLPHRHEGNSENRKVGNHVDYASCKDSSMYVNAAALNAWIGYFGPRNACKEGQEERNDVEDRIRPDKAQDDPAGKLFMLVFIEYGFDLPENGVLGEKNRWTVEGFEQVLHLYSTAKSQNSEV